MQEYYNLNKILQESPMQFLSSLLFGVSASLDSLLVGVGYGIRGVHIRPWQNLFISFVTFLGTCLSIGAGHLLIPLLPEAACRYAGSLILALLGIYYIIKWLACSLKKRHDGKPPQYGEISSASARKRQEALSLAEVFTLSLTLSLNNLGIGLSASLAGLPLLPTAVATLLCSVVLLFLGNRLGRCRLLQLAGTAAEPLSGILLMGLGLVQLIW